MMTKQGQGSGRNGSAAGAWLAAWVWGLAVALTPSVLYANPSYYNIDMLLDEPHPFASAASAQPDAESPIYGSQIRAPARFPQAAPEGEAVPRPAVEPSLMDRRGQTAVLPEEQSRTKDPALLTLAAGYYDFNDNEEAAEFRMEWRGKPLWWKLKPLAGVMATSDSAFHGFGGIAFDFYLGDHIFISPSFAPGLYSSGNGKDLGSVIEFRSGIEVGWRFSNGSRLGAMVYHISNAHITKKNPGTEVLSIGYSLPLY